MSIPPSTGNHLLQSTLPDVLTVCLVTCRANDVGYPKKPIPTVLPEAPAPHPSVALPSMGVGAPEELEQFLQQSAAGVEWHL